MLRKLICAMMALVLAFGCTAASAASVMVIGGVSTSDGNAMNIASMTAVGDTLYVLTDEGGVYTRPVGKEEYDALGEVTNSRWYNDASTLPEENPAFDRLFAMDGAPYAVCSATGAVYRLLNDAGEFAPVKREGPALDMSDMMSVDDGQGYVSQLQESSFFYQDGWLYYAGMLHNSSGTPEMRAGRISLETGKKQRFKTQALSCLAPGEDGAVWALVYDQTALYSVSSADLTAQAQYARFDPEADALIDPKPIPTENTMGGYAISGLVAGNGSLYYMDGSHVMGLDTATGETRLSAYTGQGMYGSSSGQRLFADGWYVTGDYSGVNVYMLDSESLKNGALTIFGESGSETHRAVLKQHPELSVDVAGEYTNDIEKLTQAMVADTGAYDVLLLNLAYMPVDRLIQKGYCTDLSAQAGVMERVNQMYPQLVEAVTVDGKMYGAPVQLSGNAFSVNMKLWAELGLTEDDLPTSFVELMDFVANWVYDYGEDHPDIPLFSYSQSGEMLYSLLLNNYVAYCQQQGTGLKFDTPLFRTLMESYHAIDFEEISAIADQDDEEFYWSPDALFDSASSIGYLGYQNENTQVMPLSLEEGGDPFFPVYMGVLLINPRTTRMAEAITYVESYLDNLEKVSANITLFPEHNEPVENSYYRRNKAEVEEQLSDARKRLETVSDENRADVENELKWLEERLAETENYRYTVSSEQIQHYRDIIAPYTFVMRQSVFTGANSSVAQEINKLLMQYMEGAASLDQLVKELDQRVRLMELEDQ